MRDIEKEVERLRQEKRQAEAKAQAVKVEEAAAVAAAAAARDAAKREEARRVEARKSQTVNALKQRFAAIDAPSLLRDLQRMWGVGHIHTKETLQTYTDKYDGDKELLQIVSALVFAYRSVYASATGKRTYYEVPGGNESIDRIQRTEAQTHKGIRFEMFFIGASVSFMADGQSNGGELFTGAVDSSSQLSGLPAGLTWEDVYAGWEILLVTDSDDWPRSNGCTRRVITSRQDAIGNIAYDTLGRRETNTMPQQLEEREKKLVWAVRLGRYHSPPFEEVVSSHGTNPGY